MIKCPKCGSTDIKPIGDTHYICNNKQCSKNGKPVQFKVVYDEKKEVPYNHIFANRSLKEFFKLPYLNTPKPGEE